jgi:hypothetical protein
MTVAASILLAAICGGVIFVLLDSWQRRASTPVVAPEPRAPVAAYRAQPVAPPPRVEPRRRPEGPQDSLWSGWADRRSHD